MPGHADPAFDTLAIHAGAQPDPATGARAVPIHLSTSFVFDSSDHAVSLFNLERSGHVYSRISNPTCAVLEQRVAALEGGIGAMVEGLEQIRRGEGGIDQQRQAGIVRDLRDGGNVEHLQPRIAHRLAKQQPRAGADGGAPGV